MQLYPAIDLRHGRVVRLSQGDDARATSYGDDPVAVADQFAEAGARWLHVVDLDRAFGDGDQAQTIAAIARRVGPRVQVQTGGGLRTLAAVQAALDTGVTRVVIGTAAVTDPALVPAAVVAAGADAIAVGLDARDGLVALKGWVENSGLSIEAVAARVRDAGVRTIIYTDIARDGMLTGPDLEGAVRLANLGLHVIASGGVASLEHLRAVDAAGLDGAIIGRALYERKFTLPEALACFAS